MSQRPGSSDGGRKAGGRPAGAVGAVAPKDTPQVDRVEKERPDVDVLAVGGRRDLLGDHRFRRSGRAPDDRRLAGLDQEGEHRGELAPAQRVVRGDGVWISHGQSPECGERARPEPTREPLRPRPADRRASASARYRADAGRVEMAGSTRGHDSADQPRGVTGVQVWRAVEASSACGTE